MTLFGVKWKIYDVAEKFTFILMNNGAKYTFTYIVTPERAAFDLNFIGAINYSKQKYILQVRVKLRADNFFIPKVI